MGTILPVNLKQDGMSTGNSYPGHDQPITYPVWWIRYSANYPEWTVHPEESTGGTNK